MAPAATTQHSTTQHDTNLHPPPPYPQPQKQFDGWFPLFGVLSVAIFTLYLLFCVVAGNFKLGVRFLCVELHPMKVGGWVVVQSSGFEHQYAGRLDTRFTRLTPPRPIHTPPTDQWDVHELLPLQPHPHPPVHLPHRGVRLLGAWVRRGGSGDTRTNGVDLGTRHIDTQSHKNQWDVRYDNLTDRPYPIATIPPILLQAFAGYARFSNIYHFFGVQLRYLVFFSYFYTNNVFVYMLLVRSHTVN